MLILAVMARNFNIMANRMAAKVAKDTVQAVRIGITAIKTRVNTGSKKKVKITPPNKIIGARTCRLKLLVHLLI